MLVLFMCFLAPLFFLEEYPVRSSVAFTALAWGVFMLFPGRKMWWHYMLMVPVIWLLAGAGCLVVAMVFGIKLGSWH